MILYFVRHGQTDFNKEHILQGKIFDEPLNENGIKQVTELLSHLPQDFEVIFSSPLKRVLMSAEIIERHSHKPIIIKEEISERDFGSLAGKRWNEIPNGHELREADIHQHYDYRPYGGESIEDVSNRVKRFLDECKHANYKVALVVSSIGILRLVYKLLKNTDVTEVENATIHTFEI